MTWVCPACHLEHVTTDPRIATAFHRCPKFGGLTTPFVRAGVAAKIEAHERQDYLGAERAGRVMALVTTRDDGQDTTIYAPTAVFRGRS